MRGEVNGGPTTRVVERERESERETGRKREEKRQQLVLGEEEGV